MINATNRITGEVIELDSDKPHQIVSAWRFAQEYERVSKQLKDQLKELVPKLVNENGTSDEIDNCMFRISNIQRMNYDKSVVRQILDEDTFDLFVKVDKPKLDKYLKDNLETLGDKSTELRQSMIPEGKPYTVIKLEKLTRE